MAKTASFDHYLPEYEQWFVKNRFVFLSELEAIRNVLPDQGRGVEIGVGSGIFALPLGITEGCDPSARMRGKAIERGINAIDGMAEDLPYANECFDFALMVTAICFVDSPQQSMRGIHRILKRHGELIIGFVDKNSPLGAMYVKKREKSLFYKEASFFSTEDITDLLQDNGFIIEQTRQTVFGPISGIKQIQQSENGRGKGSFIVVKAKKVYKTS